MKLGYHRDVRLSFEEAEARVRDTLQEQGFGVLTEIDVKATLKKKLDVDLLPYKILGACHPPSALRAISAVPEIGLLLPCNVTVSQNEDGSIRLAAVDAESMLAVVENPELADVAVDVNSRLRRALDSVQV
jgi:uncharacterized protein (DUF302 family)